MGALFAIYTWLLCRKLKSLQLDELFSFTQVVLPTFILERRSLLEMYADFFAHPDLFVRYLTLELEHSLLLMLLMALVGCHMLVVLKNIAWILVETSKNSQISQTCSCKTCKHQLNFPVSQVPAYISLCLSFFLSLSVALVTRRIPRRGWSRWLSGTCQLSMQEGKAQLLRSLTIPSWGRSSAATGCCLALRMTW